VYVCVCAGLCAVLRECDRWYHSVRSLRPPHCRLRHLQEVQHLDARGRESDTSAVVQLLDACGCESDTRVVVQHLDVRGCESDSSLIVQRLDVGGCESHAVSLYLKVAILACSVLRCRVLSLLAHTLRGISVLGCMLACLMFWNLKLLMLGYLACKGKKHILECVRVHARVLSV